METKIAALVEALRAVEWQYNEHAASGHGAMECVSCGVHQPHPHAPDCIVGRALSAADARPIIGVESWIAYAGHLERALKMRGEPFNDDVWPFTKRPASGG